MQLNKLTRFIKASSLLALVALMVASIAPVTRAQEFGSFNRRLLNFPGGLGNNISVGGPAIFGGGTLFTGSDVVSGDYNGDTFHDIIIGSLFSDEIAIYLGRGNGSFVQTTVFSIGGVVGDGTVTSMANISSSTGTGIGQIIAAVDYTAISGATDRVNLITINLQGQVIGNGSFAVATVASNNINPVALAVGSLDAGGGVDIAVLCSGLDGSGTEVDPGNAGFVSIQRGGGAAVQRIGGGVNGALTVVAEGSGVGTGAAVSGSLYDTRSNLGATGLNVNNTYVFAASQGNRRLFRVTPRTGFANAAIATSPRAVSFGNTAHRDDGANDVFFAAVDFGSANTGARIHDATPAQGRQPEGSVFVLANDTQSAGNLFRNGRRLDEQFDFSNNAFIPNGPGQQNGVILRAGNLPSGVASADFNGDNRLDLCASNSGSTNVSIYNSAMINEINFPGTTTTTQIQSYGTPTFINISGAPNTVYASDLTGDGRPDIYGTSTGVNGGYLITGNSATPGTFGLGALTINNTPPGQNASPGNGCRALAATFTAFNGLAGITITAGAFGTPVNFNGGIQDIVFVRNSGISGGFVVRYGVAQAAASYTASPIFLSSLVGVAEGRINGDTIPDLAICDRGADRVIVLTNSASGFSGTGTPVVTFIDLADYFPNIETGGLSSLDIGDVDKNNTTDIVTTVDGPNDQVIVLYNIGGFSDIDARFTIRAFPIGGDPTAVRLADLAGPAGPGQGGSTGKDGAPEIIALNRRSNTVTTLINNGIGIFGQGRVAESGGFDPVSQALGDFNDDGKIDTAVLNRGRRLPTGAGFFEDESIVSILAGVGDGSFRATNFLIPVPRRSVSIVAGGYNIVRQAINIDVPDFNLDGLTDLAVASELGGGPSSDIVFPHGTNEAGALTVLFGSATQAGQFVRNTGFQPLVDSFSGGRIAMLPGADDVRDGRRIGYGVLTVNADFNQNGRPDAHVGGQEFNNGGVPTFFFPFSLEETFAGSITSLDSLGQAIAAQRQFNVFPSFANNPALANPRVPVDTDQITGCVSASSYVVSNTGAVVGQDVNDFFPNANISPDVVQVTVIGRAYEAINNTSILNHAPLVTTSRGNADFTNYNDFGRKIVMNEGEEVKLTLRASDVDPSAPGSIRFSLLTFPSFVSMVDNNNGTATLTIKPSLTDGSATANNGLGQAYPFTAQANDNDFRLPLTGQVFFRIFVKDKPTAPAIAPLADQRAFATQVLTVPVTATSLTNRTIRLATTFTAPFSTFADAGGGAGSFRFAPADDLAQKGDYNVTVTATDDLGLSSTATFKLTVIVNSAPTVAAIANVTMVAGENREVQFTAQDIDAGQALSFSVEGPGFAVLRSTGANTGAIKLEPQVNNDAGTFTVRVVGRDNGIPSKSATQSFTVTVNPAVRVTGSSFASKRLFVSGLGFGTSPTVTVNGVALPASKLVPGSTDSSITAKGANKKDLNLRKGSNTIQVTGVGGQKSNTFTLNLAAADVD